MGTEGNEGVSEENDTQKVHVTSLSDKNNLKKTCDNSDLQHNTKGNKFKMHMQVKEIDVKEIISGHAIIIINNA